MLLGKKSSGAENLLKMNWRDGVVFVAAFGAAAALAAGPAHAQARVGEAAFVKMKKTASIINTARGGLIDEAALLAALDAGKISGAAIDVLESETAVTPIRSALVRHPKMIVTAHTAWLSEQARATLQLRAIEQVLACLKGETPYGLINRELARQNPHP